MLVVCGRGVVFVMVVVHLANMLRSAEIEKEGGRRVCEGHGPSFIVGMGSRAHWRGLC